MTSFKKILWLSTQVYFFVLPLLFFPFGQEFFERPKVIFTFMFGITALSLLMVSHSATLPEVLKKNLIGILIILLSFAFVFTSLIGINFEYSLLGNHGLTNGLVQTFGLLFLYITLLFLQKFGFDVYSLTEFLFWGITVAAVIGIIHMVLVQLRFVSSDFMYDGRTVATLGQPNFLGSLLALNIVYRLDKFLVSKNIVSLLVILLNFICLLFTFSRSGFLSLFVGVFLLLLSKRYFKFVLLIFVLVCAAGFILIKNIDQTREEANYTLYYQFQRIADSEGMELRNNLWIESIKAIAKSPLFGYGKGQVNSALYSVMSEASPLHMFNIAGSHSIFLDVLLEGGFVVLAILVSLLALIIHKIYEQKKFVWLFLLIMLLMSANLDLSSVIYWVLLLPLVASLNTYVVRKL
jgi:O-antigen ligase